MLGTSATVGEAQPTGHPYPLPSACRPRRGWSFVAGVPRRRVPPRAVGEDKLEAAHPGASPLLTLSLSRYLSLPRELHPKRSRRLVAVELVASELPVGRLGAWATRRAPLLLLHRLAGAEELHCDADELIPFQSPP